MTAKKATTKAPNGNPNLQLTNPIPAAKRGRPGRAQSAERVLAWLQDNRAALLPHTAGWYVLPSGAATPGSGPTPSEAIADYLALQKRTGAAARHIAAALKPFAKVTPDE